MFEDTAFPRGLFSEYLPHEASGTTGPYSSDWPWPTYTSPTGCDYTGFVTPPFPVFVPMLLHFLAFTKRLFPDILFSRHLRRRHSLRKRPRHNMADNHLQSRTAVKAQPRSTTSEESGAAVCAEISFVISTNANDI